VLDHCRILDQRVTEGCGNAVSGEVVGGRPEPADRHHDLGPGQRLSQRRCQPAEIVADGLAVGLREAALRQHGRQGCGVRVDDLAQQEFGPDRHGLGSHGPIVGLARPGPAPTCP
jgi:hypothetical protein